MGLIKAIKNAVSTATADQWREYFYCDALNNEILATKGKKRVSGKGSNTKGEDNIISNGSVVAVNEGQCMMIVDQGKVVEFCAEAGEFVYDTSSEPSLFYGDFGESLGRTFEIIGRRFTFGGDTAKEQRVYFFNTKEIMGNKYGTASPVPFRVVDANIGLDIDITLRCNGEYSYRITDPLLFYKNVCGNITGNFTKNEIESQLKTELLTALQPAFARVSEMGVRYSSIPKHTTEMVGILNEELSAKWSELRGISMVSFGMNSIKAPEEDEAMIKELQRTAVYRNPNMAAASLVNAQADAMRAAASNTSTGPMMAFAGMNMANMAGGMNANALFSMGQQQAAGAPQMQQGMNGGQAVGNPGNGAGWVCSCGQVNKGRFCSECGQKKPAGEALYRCDKCGWEPEDPKNPPKFCPECGDPFNENDIR
ncbi:MAG: SPFH domain-containing protein [Lachnospiraceae bacterium]|jgi:membrane protease subunit (stomatin/prohibitin family)|nr:SPFH domain-containing protein [Lachnospiraceae bacterium]